MNVYTMSADKLHVTYFHKTEVQNGVSKNNMHFAKAYNQVCQRSAGKCVLID